MERVHFFSYKERTIRLGGEQEVGVASSFVCLFVFVLVLFLFCFGLFFRPIYQYTYLRWPSCCIFANQVSQFSFDRCKITLKKHILKSDLLTLFRLIVVIGSIVGKRYFLS